MATKEPDNVIKIHRRHAEASQTHRHHALDLEEPLNPALGQVDLLLDVRLPPRADRDGKARRVDVEPGAAVRPHPLQFAVQPGAEVDIGRATLKLVDLVKQFVLRSQSGIGALVPREGLEPHLVRVNGDDRIENVRKLILVRVKIFNIR